LGFINAIDFQLQFTRLQNCSVYGINYNYFAEIEIL